MKWTEFQVKKWTVTVHQMFSIDSWCIGIDVVNLGGKHVDGDYHRWYIWIHLLPVKFMIDFVANVGAWRGNDAS